MPAFGGNVCWADGEAQPALYFPLADYSGLGIQRRAVSCRDNPTARARALAAALEDGPEGDLAPAFLPGHGVRQVFVDRNGTVFLDLAANRDRLPGVGAIQERLCLWSLVNTLCLNMKEIKRVKILVGGDEAVSLAGHVDLTNPLIPDLGAVK